VEVRSNSYTAETCGYMNTL